MRLVLSGPALADLDRLHRFLIAKNPNAAARAAAVIDSAIVSLAQLPERGHPLGALGMRELVIPFGQSAYVLRYVHSPDRNEIVILRVWHGREDRE